MEMEISIDTFCKIIGAPTNADILGHIHAGLRSMDKAPLRRYHAKRDEMFAKHQDATHIYQALCEAGVISRPRKPTREEIAAGDPTLPHVQAARRVLEKQSICAKNAHTEKVGAALACPVNSSAALGVEMSKA